MCGICGIVAEPDEIVDEAIVRRMCSAIVHRGPDEEGYFVEGEVGLGMRRLSIIDLAGGSQPVFNEDHNVVVVFNGEIYNFEALRRDLESRGHRFASRSDTEVIVHLYEERGLDFLQDLNGMFAIALWDKRRRRLVLGRDRLGKKPLYYRLRDGRLSFGSELKCLMQVPGGSFDLDPQAVHHYFTLGYIPNPVTIYQGVQQLPPATQLVFEAGRAQLSRYWQLPRQVDPRLTREEAVSNLRDLVSDAVRLRLISDVPLGAFLSGGLDSSIIVAVAAQQLSSPLRTFHIDFGDPEVSELKYAREVAARYGTDHTELVVTPDATSILDDVVQFFDEPFGDASAVPTFYVSQLTRRHVTVALAGDGGDECFGGYARYQKVLARANWPRPVRWMFGKFGEIVHACLPRQAPGRRFFRSLGMDRFEFYAVGSQELETREILDRDFGRTLDGASTLRWMRDWLEQGDPGDPLAPYTYCDSNVYLPDDILTKVDRMSMAHSLEVRAPLLDYRICELAARMPSRWKIDGGNTKQILKEAFAKELPPSVLSQRKRGFSMPLDRWLRKELRPQVEAALTDRSVREAGIFNPRELEAMAGEHFSGRRDRSDLLWRFLVFTRWWHEHHRRCHQAAWTRAGQAAPLEPAR